MQEASASNEFQVADWRVSRYENGAQLSGPDWASELGALIPRLQCPEIILKHDHRSLVGLFQMNGERYAVKQFMLQHTWIWFQWTSLLFPSLGRIAYENAARLRADGIRIPTPVLLLERRKLGMVRDSWLVYNYLDGAALTVGDGVELVGFLKRMHNAGWVHRDPHPANFIRTPDGIATIDYIKTRRRRSRYLRAYDVVLVAQNIPNAPELYGCAELGIWFDLAQKGHWLVRQYRNIKRALRQPHVRKVRDESPSNHNSK